MRDEQFYGAAASEVVERRFNRDLMAKAYAIAIGDPDRTQAIYIGLRAEQLKQAAIAEQALVTLQEKIQQEQARAHTAAEQKERAKAAKRKNKEAEELENKMHELRAQRAERGWADNSFDNGSIPQAAKPSPQPEPPKPLGPPMTPEELENSIKSLKALLGTKT